jgi:twinkle protein
MRIAVQVGVADFAFQNQAGEWVDEACLTFPWIRMLPNGKPMCVRQKVRSLTQKAHMRLHPAGAEWGLFGWHTVPTTWNDAIVLAEGEFDAMAIHQATGLPALSLPNGSQSLPIQVGHR